MTTMKQLRDLADTMQRETLEELVKRHGSTPEFWASHAATKITQGQKYTRVDIGGSGRYMVDAAGNIYGCKGYGVIHRGHYFGTLDTINDYYWGGYVAVRKQRMEAVK